MSDVMLLGALRMPIGDDPDPMTLRQFVDRARQAADRIEADTADAQRYRRLCALVGFGMFGVQYPVNAEKDQFADDKADLDRILDSVLWIEEAAAIARVTGGTGPDT